MKKVIYLLACVAFLGCYSCSDDDDGLKMQDISVEFAVSDAGMDGTGIDLGIKLSRATKESLDVTVQIDDFYGGIRVGYYRYPGSD